MNYRRYLRLWTLLGFSFSANLFAQLSTADHLAEPGFWPTRGDLPRAEYTGSQVCASCHAGKVASQKTTPMAQTTMRAQDAEILHRNPELKFTIGKYLYEIRSQGAQNIYTVRDGEHAISANLLWAFGIARAGQSYLFKKADGKFYEARVTYFSSIHGLHFTPGRELADPKDLEEAMYRPVPTAEVEHCFTCHATASSVEGKLDEQNLILGVSCEACHGPGAKHVAAAQAATAAGTPDAARGTIFNASTLEAADSVDFCGACHTTFWDVKLTGAKGVATAKAQPFRLEESKCWGKGDARMTCIACHDPHVPLETNFAAYDRACLRCHTVAGTKASAQQTVKACPVAAKDCATCHMPKIYDPEMHHEFVDHRIRVVRKGEAYPD